VERATRFHVTYLMIALFGVLLLHDLWASYRTVAHLPYSEFEKLLASDAVAKVMVEGVAKLRERKPEMVEKSFQGIESLVRNAALCIEAGDLRGLGKLLDLNQMLLAGLFLSTPEIELACALAHRDRGVVGLDLAGDEARHPANQFASHFRRAREAGLHLTAHAGEFAGADSVRKTVLTLGVERVGHAVHAVDDPEVLDLLAEKQIAVESCPTSNLLTCAVPSFAAHPLPIFLDRGLCTVLNTDDPTLFGGISLEDEFRIAREEIGLSDGQLTRLRENGLRAAFLTPTEKKEFRF
jgi:adenosine deaminase